MAAKTSVAMLVIACTCSLRAQTNWPGYIDTSFTATCISNAAYNNTVKGILVQGDGKVVAVGGFSSQYIVSGCANAIFRCDSNGVPDNTFSSPFGGLSSLNTVTAVAGGRLLVAGSFSIPNNSKTFALARLQSNGALDGTFTLTQSNPPMANLTGNAVGTDASDRIIVGGTLYQAGFRAYIKRLNINGTEDGTFAGGAISAPGVGGITALAVQSDNKIIIAGPFADVGGMARPNLARLNENGTLDSTFQPQFTAIYSVGAIKLLANGQMFVTGQFTTNGPFNLVLARLNTDGSIDPSFPPITAGAVAGTALAMQADGKIIITHSSGASRFSANGVLDANYFQGAGDIANHGFVSLAIDAGARALVGGENAKLDTTERRGLIRLFGGNAPVPAPPSIDVQPTNVTAFAGGNASFTVVASGSAPLIYNWFFGGANVGGGENVTFNSVQLAHDGTSIYCLVMNLYGRATSSVVTLHVVSAPIAPTITMGPGSVSVMNPAPIAASDLMEVNLRDKILHMHILGGATPFPPSGDYDIALATSGNTYSIPSGGAMTASSGNWTFGSDLGINTVLTLDSAFPGTSGGPVKVALLTDGTYEMYADGVVNNQNGTYTRAYSDGTPIGPTVTFTVAATGTAPLAYEWLFEGSPFSLPTANALTAAAATVFPPDNVYGAHTPTLIISNATTANAGKYSVRVSNIVSQVTSAEATLTVNGFSGGPPDSEKPTLKITGPAATLKTIGSNTVNFAGTAQDSVGLAGVFVSVNGGPSVAATGTANWSASVGLLPGTNIIQVRATDLSGNAVTNTRVLVHVPSIALKGVYNGLFYDTNMPAHASAGAVSLSLATSAKFNGKLHQGAKIYPFKGTFGSGLDAEATVLRAGQSALQLSLHLMNGRIEGTVRDGANWNGQLFAERAGPVGALAGKHNMLWQPNYPAPFLPANIPEGDSFASLTLSAAGRLSGTATLGEGTPAKILAAVSPAGKTPLYVPLYGGTGSMFGWLTFSGPPLNEVYGACYWFKPDSVGGPRYPLGFTNLVFATGSRYVAPPAGTPALTLATGVVVLSGGGLAAPITDSVALGSDNKISGDHQLTITISAPKGTFTGSFFDSTSSAMRLIRGVILQRQSIGGGQFLTTDGSGRVFVGDQP